MFSLRDVEDFLEPGGIGSHNSQSLLFVAVVANVAVVSFVMVREGLKTANTTFLNVQPFKLDWLIILACCPVSFQVNRLYRTNAMCIFSHSFKHGLFVPKV